MNILPKKKWNVYNTKNKERVQRDEREHQTKLINERIRHEEIESENRYRQLKEDLKKKRKLEEKEEEEEEDKGSGDFNSSDDENINNQIGPTVATSNELPSEKSISSLFKGIEDKIIAYNRNNNTNNKDIDLNKISNSKLGEGSYEYKKEKPFWESNISNNDKEYKDMNRKEKKKFKSEQWYKTKEDPIRLVDKALGRESSSKYSSNNNNKTIKSTNSSSSLSTKKTIDQLRKERLEREQKERKKETLLINSTNNNSNNNNNLEEFSYIKYSGGILKNKSNKPNK